MVDDAARRAPLLARVGEAHSLGVHATARRTGPLRGTCVPMVADRMRRDVSFDWAAVNPFLRPSMEADRLAGDAARPHGARRTSAPSDTSLPT